MTPDGTSASAADLRRLASNSLVTGLCNLIPVPLVDDWARDLMRQRHAMELARGYGVELDAVDGKALACGYRPVSAHGCFRGCLLTAIVKPTRFIIDKVFRKILRKVLFFLTIKDVVDTVSESFHEGYLLRHALAIGALQGSGGGPPATGAPRSGWPDPEVLAVRLAIEAACDAVDHRPVEKAIGATLRGSRRIYRQAGRAFSRLVRSKRGSGDEQEIYESLERQGEEQLGSLIDEITADLEQESSYLRRLEKIFEHRLTALKSEPGQTHQMS
ncbi:MAG: hypothetical protein V3T72_10560 [Thermoanaerobaculia bacterium]